MDPAKPEKNPAIAWLLCTVVRVANPTSIKPDLSEFLLDTSRLRHSAHTVFEFDFELIESNVKIFSLSIPYLN